MGTVIDPVPVTGLAANVSPIPRTAPPPLGKEIDGGVNGRSAPPRSGSFWPRMPVPRRRGRSAGGRGRGARGRKTLTDLAEARYPGRQQVVGRTEKLGLAPPACGLRTNPPGRRRRREHDTTRPDLPVGLWNWN